jgi:beta-lactamase class A
MLKPKLLFLIFVISISTVISIVVSNLLYKKFANSETNKVETNGNKKQTEISDVKITRLKGYRYVKPLLFADKSTSSELLQSLKRTLQEEINTRIREGSISKAAVYIKAYKNGEWIGINEDEQFHPGSLIKVPILITYMKMEELQPGTLNKKIPFESSSKNIPPQSFNSFQIIPGKSYTIRELLKFMIAYSDNNATYLLNKNVNLDLFVKLFTDLGIPKPDVMSKDYSISPRDYSSFFKVIYNAGYLSYENSEFAAELLGMCDFKDGLLKGLPPNTQVAHKFGEWGDAINHQLHESGFVYIGNSTYLITIMTEGNDVKKLPDVISALSKKAYSDLQEKNVSSK